MLYPLSSYINAFLLFFGAAAGCLLCIVCAAVFKKKCYKFRLSLFFLLLSISLVFVIFFMLRLKEAEKGPLLLFARQNALFLILYFALGLFCSVSLKVIFPLALLLYTAFTFIAALGLYGAMPLPQKYSLAASSSFVRDEESGLVYDFESPAAFEEDGSELCSLVLTVYELDDAFLLPLPHIWYSLSDALGAGASEKEARLLEGLFAQNEGSAVKKLQAKICRRILKKPVARLVPVKKQAVYPCLFELEVRASGGGLKTVLKRVM